MGRKAIIFCISLIAVLLAGVAVAVSFLYSGVEQKESVAEIPDNSRFGIWHAVPSDAVIVADFASGALMSESLGDDSVLGAIAGNHASFGKFLERVSALGPDWGRTVVSFHYNGSLVPLMIADAGRSGAEQSDGIRKIIAAADSAGVYSEYIDCGPVAAKGTWLEKRSLLLVSSSDVLLQSSRRHVGRGVSVLSLDGFAEAAGKAEGNFTVLFSHAGADKIFADAFGRPYRRYAGFFKKLSDWTAFSIDKSETGLKMLGEPVCGRGQDRFLNVLGRSGGASHARIAETVPSYTVFAASLPADNISGYISAYSAYCDAGSGNAGYEARHKELKAAAGIAPKEWAESLDIKEAGIACFHVGRKMETVLLLRPGNGDSEIISGALGTASLKDYVPASHPYPYAGFAASLFGGLFALPDESRFTYINGWIIAGSDAAVQEYVSGRALENPLRTYLADAGAYALENLKGMSFFSYFSLTEDTGILDGIFTPSVAAALKKSVSETALASVFVAVDKSGSIVGEEVKVREFKSRAPVFERDTVITVPKGPYEVKNSATGRMNTFYQQDNMYLCLNDDKGKGLWGVKFSTPLCGRAGTVDYFANGKLQILFASGSKLYLIDRLGRFVKPFPVSLGREILIGPDIYDFNGTRKYNVMVLHKDNVIDMYNLQGRKPSGWLGITAKEKIMNLPEAVKAGGRTWWVVRTSIQTLIFPFLGGKPVTVFEGDRMIRPDSRVTPVKNGVEVTHYDGRKTTIEL